MILLSLPSCCPLLVGPWDLKSESIFKFSNFLCYLRAIVDGKVVARKYTPISRIDRKETFELLVKIYHKTEQFPDGGVMSQFLDSLQIN